MRRDPTRRGRGMRIAAVVLLATALPACGSLGPDCADVRIHGIAVQAVDSITGELATGPLRVVATDGPYADTVEVEEEGTVPATLYLALERPGTYRVEVESDDYRPWFRRDVEVRRTVDECHVLPEELTALLQPL